MYVQKKREQFLQKYSTARAGMNGHQLHHYERTILRAVKPPEAMEV